MVCRGGAITVWREIFVRKVFRGIRISVCKSFWNSSRTCLRGSICSRGEWPGESRVIGCSTGQLQKLPGKSEVVECGARWLWGLEMGSEGG